MHHRYVQNQPTADVCGMPWSKQGRTGRLSFSSVAVFLEDRYLAVQVQTCKGTPDCRRHVTGHKPPGPFLACSCQESPGLSCSRRRSQHSGTRGGCRPSTERHAA